MLVSLATIKMGLMFLKTLSIDLPCCTPISLWGLMPKRLYKSMCYRGEHIYACCFTIQNT